MADEKKAGDIEIPEHLQVTLNTDGTINFAQNDNNITLHHSMIFPVIRMLSAIYDELLTPSEPLEKNEPKTD